MFIDSSNIKGFALDFMKIMLKNCEISLKKNT